MRQGIYGLRHLSQELTLPAMLLGAKTRWEKTASRLKFMVG